MKLFPMCILFFLASFSQNPVQPEDISHYRQFDFWLGDWNVFTNNELVGQNNVLLQQNGFVLQENWISEKENFTGTSYSFYNAKISQWQQIWIDKNGSNLLLRGNFENGKMILHSDSDSNMGETKSLHKISWTLLSNGDVKQVWESSINGGEIGNVQFEGIYKKKKQP